MKSVSTKSSVTGKYIHHWALNGFKYLSYLNALCQLRRLMSNDNGGLPIRRQLAKDQEVIVNVV